MRWPRSLRELPRTLLGSHVLAAKNRPSELGSLEERVAVLEIEAAARNLLLRYAYCYDAGDLDGLMEIYAEDCIVVSRRGTYVGTDAVRENYARAVSERKVSFHHIANSAVWPSPDRTEAWVTGYLHNLLVRESGPGGAMSSFVFHIRRDDGEWKVVETRIAISNQHSYGPAGARTHIPKPVEPTRPETVADLIDDLG
jgi:ketosteroid isomerase-like protein